MLLNKNISFFCLFFLFYFSACGQNASNRPRCESAVFDKTLSAMLNFSVPVIGVEDLRRQQSNYTLLDAREAKEFEVSHIAGARNIGYDKFSLATLADLDKKTPIVVYCSVGYRSEKIGEKLLAAGFTNVKNLYGSIFEWTNRGFPLVEKNNMPSATIHTYNKTWSVWVKNKKVQKVWN